MAIWTVVYRKYLVDSANALRPKLLPARTDGVVRRTRRARNPRCPLSLGTRRKGRSLRPRPSRHPAGVREGREDLVKARVAVHEFRTAAVAEPVNEGLEIAQEAYAAGQAALHEKDVRRIGLGLSLITILVTMAGLWVAIRSIESKGAG